MARKYYREWDGEKGRAVLTGDQEQFLDWLCGEKPIVEGRPESQNAYAVRTGIPRPTLTGWKRDPNFIDHWNERLQRTFLHPETVGDILATLAGKAKAGDVKAIELYWKMTQGMSPQEQETANLEELSDEELEALRGENAR